MNTCQKKVNNIIGCTEWNEGRKRRDNEGHTMKRRPTSKDMNGDYDEVKREEDAEEQGRGKRTVRMDKIFVT